MRISSSSPHLAISHRYRASHLDRDLVGSRRSRSHRRSSVSRSSRFINRACIVLPATTSFSFSACHLLLPGSRPISSIVACISDAMRSHRDRIVRAFDRSFCRSTAHHRRASLYLSAHRRWTSHHLFRVFRIFTLIALFSFHLSFIIAHFALARTHASLFIHARTRRIRARHVFTFAHRTFPHRIFCTHLYHHRTRAHHTFSHAPHHRSMSRFLSSNVMRSSMSRRRSPFAVRAFVRIAIVRVQTTFVRSLTTLIRPAVLPPGSFCLYLSLYMPVDRSHRSFAPAVTTFVRSFVITFVLLLDRSMRSLSHRRVVLVRSSWMAFVIVRRSTA